MSDLEKYSIDMMKKSCFIDELQELKIKYPEPDNLTKAIIDYLEQRIKEFEKKYKIK